MNAQTNEVAMKVNQANLVKSLRFSFTNKTTVLGELIQNARRAHAAMVVINFPDYKAASATTSFRQGLPESRSHGCVRRLPSLASGSRQSLPR